MKAFFDYIRCFAFKNIFAFFVTLGLLYLLKTEPNLKDIITIFLTLVLKYYFDSNVNSSKKDDVISKALDNAQNTPATPNATL